MGFSFAMTSGVLMSVVLVFYDMGGTLLLLLSLLLLLVAMVVLVASASMIG